MRPDEEEKELKRVFGEEPRPSLSTNDLIALAIVCATVLAIVLAFTLT